MDQIAVGIFQNYFTGTCKPFLDAILNRLKYLISSMDDFSHYAYIFLTADKFRLDTHKLYKTKVGNQLEKKKQSCKIWSWRQYYGRYNE